MILACKWHLKTASQTFEFEYLLMLECLFQLNCSSVLLLRPVVKTITTCFNLQDFITLRLFISLLLLLGFFFTEATPFLSVIYSLYQQPQAVNAILKMLCVLLMAMQRSAVICCALLLLEARDLSGCFRAVKRTCLSLT